MRDESQKLDEIKKLLDEAENNIQAARRILFEDFFQQQAINLKTSSFGKTSIIEGIFNGVEMIDSTGKKYPMPVNYCSKSKLVSGDGLKLQILEDGSFVYKQINPIERRKLVGYLRNFQGKWHAEVNDRRYQLLPAAVTYFKGKDGDRLTIIVPKNGIAEWAAIENMREKSD